MKEKEKNILFYSLIIFLAIIILISWFVVTTKENSPTEDYFNNNYEGEEINYNPDGSYDWESVYGDDWEGYLQEELEEEGYEVMSLYFRDVASSPLVIYFGDQNNINSNEKTIRVEMKSLGNRAEQIQSVLVNSALIEDVYGFWVEIHEPTKTCTYTIKWDDWVSCLDGTTYCDPDKFVAETSLLTCE
jgi:hypothetical protein